MRSRFVLIAITAIAGAAVALAVNQYFAARAGSGFDSFADAPGQSYTVPALDGGTGSLAQYRGHLVLLNLWASWCAPCRSETPALERLYQQDRLRGLVVLGVDQGEARDAVAAFVRSMRLTYPILLDENQRYGSSYAAVGLPTSVLIGLDGKVLRGIDGELSFAQMEALVDGPLGIRRARR